MRARFACASVDECGFGVSDGGSRRRMVPVPTVATPVPQWVAEPGVD